MTRALARATLVAAACALSGCATLQNWLPPVPAPPQVGQWFNGWFGLVKTHKPGPLPALTPVANPQINWQVGIGRAAPGLAPAVTPDAVYVAASDGALMKVDGATGRVVWRTSVGQRLSAGPGASDKRVVVGTDKGDVYGFDGEGKPAWTARVSSEVIAPPQVADNIAIVFSGDGRVFGLDAADGKTKWVYQRANPPLSLRSVAGGVAARGGLFFGTAGGRLLGLDVENGNVGWDATVATPRGATELERIADVTSLPLVDEKQVCAVAYQGRVACFELVRGTLLWSRDLSSVSGLAGDARNVYVTDEKGSVQALDKQSGASVWKQDALAARKIGGPQLVGDYLGVVDVEGYLHLLARADGKYVGRIATDGKAPTTQPAALGSGAVWLSEAGTMYAVTAR